MYNFHPSIHPFFYSSTHLSSHPTIHLHIHSQNHLWSIKSCVFHFHLSTDSLYKNSPAYPHLPKHQSFSLLLHSFSHSTGHSSICSLYSPICQPIFLSTDSSIYPMNLPMNLLNLDIHQPLTHSLTCHHSFLKTPILPSTYQITHLSIPFIPIYRTPPMCQTLCWVLG